MLQAATPIRIRVSFEDYRLLANGAQLLPAVLALYPNLHELVQMHLDQGDVPRRVNSCDKAMTLVSPLWLGATA